MGWLRRSAGIDVAGTGTPMVCLNVGGTLFSTNTRTLSDYCECCPAFRDAVAGSGRRAADGALLIDRDPTTFRHVLNYMRNNKLLLLPDDFSDWDLFLADSQFYGLKELEAAILGNYDYQRRTFRRQLPTGAVLRWIEVNEIGPATLTTPAASLNVASPASPSPTTATKVTVNPLLPAFHVDEVSGTLLHQQSPVSSLEAATTILSTIYGYKIQHWHKDVSETVEDLSASSPAEQQPASTGTFYGKKGTLTTLTAPTVKKIVTTTQTIYLAL